jgi:uncharacterized membrane protein
VGLKTGQPFGAYHYTNQWRPCLEIPSVGFYPVLLPFAWVLVVGSGALAVQNIEPTWLACLLAAALACGLDLVMEGTLAGKMNYWHWDLRGPLPGGSPWTNSIAWLILSALGARTVLTPGRAKSRPLEPIVVLVGQWVLMVGLGLS